MPDSPTCAGLPSGLTTLIAMQSKGRPSVVDDFSADLADSVIVLASDSVMPQHEPTKAPRSLQVDQDRRNGGASTQELRKSRRPLGAVCERLAHVRQKNCGSRRVSDALLRHQSKRCLGIPAILKHDSGA